MKRALLWIWTFPCPLMAWVNRKGGKLLPLVGLIGKEVPLPLPGAREFVTFAYVYKWWGGSRRFSFAAWPNIYVSREGRINDDELMWHEWKHLDDQAKFGGVLFLAIYLGEFFFRWFWHRFDWYDAYRNLWFEKRARAFAREKMKEMRDGSEE